MKTKKWATASAIAVAAGASFAAGRPTSIGGDGAIVFALSGVTGATFSETWSDGIDVAALPHKLESSMTSFGSVKFTEVNPTGFTFDVLDSGALSAVSGTSASRGLPSTLEINGANDALGSFGGQLMVTPVPEPTYALMLGGLGAIGFMARRRMF